jgi:nickel transport protein
MRRFVRFCLFMLLASGLATAHAHGVQHRIEPGQAIVVTLSYGNGKPYAHEAFALYAAGTAKPMLKGITDAMGRAVFIPDAASQWRLETHARHGHGTVFDFTVPAAPPAPPAAETQQSALPPAPPTPAPAGPNRASLILFGLSLVFGGFGLYQLFLRRRKA